MTLNTKTKVGLTLAGLLGVLDVVSYFGPQPGPGVPGPPHWILVLDAVLGVITVLAVVLAFRQPSGLAIGGIFASRIASALTAVPAFFVDGVPSGIKLLVAAFLVVTIVSLALILPKRTPA